MYKNLLILLLFISPTFLIGQEEKNQFDSVASDEKIGLSISGKVVDFESDQSVKGCIVNVYVNNDKIDSQVTAEDGKYDFFFPLDKNYKFEFSKPGYIAKSLKINGAAIPETNQPLGFEIGGMKVTIFKDTNNFDFSLLKKPLDIFNYDTISKSMVRDEDYSDQMAIKLNKVLYKAGLIEFIDLTDANDSDLLIYGTVKDYNTRVQLSDYYIDVYVGEDKIGSFEADSLGKYEIYLPLDFKYAIRYSQSGYVSKLIEINAEDIPFSNRRAGFSIGPLDATLFNHTPGIDFSLLDKPVGKFKYTDEDGAFKWDVDYGKSMADKIDDIFPVIAKSNEDAIHLLMDNWHKAAAQADEETYFNSMTDDAIFLGTDKTERWEKKVFEEWADPHFQKDKAWAFTSRDRVIYFHDDNRVAWFEELLDTWMGTCRGSGVVVLTEDGWKIKHYNLALLVDNDKMDKVIEVTK